MIRLAEIEEIPEILSVTKACANHMISNKIFQWNEGYPSQSAFENDILRNELYVFLLNENLIGTLVLTPKMDEEYIPIKWRTQSKNNLYIHRLSIHPKHQGKGFAQQLMDFAESFAIENNYSSIRLDTFSKNLRNQKFYELRDYIKTGIVFFPNQSSAPFYCYEKVLL
ncbi:MAG: ribosomal protein S18 acetylase RimI-like enzyme [Flavobacteriaceae bacterium]|jgi:ribosomal protein S18 acetylase RimI-like enzyme